MGKERRLSVADELRHDMPVIEAVARPLARPSDYLRETLKSLEDFATGRGVKLSQVVVFSDIDGSLRNPIKEVLSGHPGRLPDDCLAVLRRVEQTGVTVAGFITDQPLEGHQVARLVGGVFDYHSMKKTLEDVFPKAKLIFPGRSWQFLGSKRRGDFIQKVCEAVTPYAKDTNVRLIAYVGDRFNADGHLWGRVKELQSHGDKLVFIKVPSFFDTLLGGLVSRII